MINGYDKLNHPLPSTLKMIDHLVPRRGPDDAVGKLTPRLSEGPLSTIPTAFAVKGT